MDKMNRAKTRTAAEIGSLPDELESARAKLVYLYLLTAGGSTLSELQVALKMKKIMLLSLLDALGEQGLIDCDDDEYRLVV